MVTRATRAIEKPCVGRTEATAHKSSRNGRAIDHIVIHYTTSRNIEGSITHFKAGTPRTSAHYIVGRDGQLVQMVPDADCAWHAGTSDMNLRSIGIEHVARAGDKITKLQSRTSIALIRWLMLTYPIPLAHIVPHVCIKATSCCGDLFKDFGGGANAPCAEQKAALHKWLAANGIADIGSAIATRPPELPGHGITPQPEQAAGPNRMTMARTIVDFEARRDQQGRITIYRLPAGDGGGRYEVAGLNERYHKQVCDELMALIRSGRAAEAEARATEVVAAYTDRAATWTHSPGIELFLRDCMFNRGPAGAAWILQKAVSVETDMAVGPITLAAAQAAEASPRQLLERLRQSREAYERLRRNETSPFWAGLVNRWNSAHAKALDLLVIHEGSAPRSSPQALSSPTEGTTAPAR